MPHQPQLIEPISILTNTIISFIKENKVNTNLINPTFERIYQLILIDLASNIADVSDNTNIGLTNQSDNIEILYKYVIDNIDYLGLATKKFAFSLAEFLKTEDYEQIHPLYVELTEMGEKLIQETKILKSDQPFIVAYK